MADQFELGGSGAAGRTGFGTNPAITVGGVTTTYDQLRALVDAVELPTNGPAQLCGPDLVTAMSVLFAAARSKVPVLVGADRAPHPQDLPPGAFLLVSTSGSSGRPRMLARSAESWVASFRPLADLTGLGQTDTVRLTGPIDSTLHLFAAVHTLWLGAHLTDDPTTTTAVHAVPTVLGDLLENPPPRLRTAVVAGARLPPAMEKRAHDLGLRLIEYYGAAELSFVAARIAPAPLRPFPGTQVRITDGEIWVRSPYVALERLDPPARLRRSPDGYLTVGDLGRIDPDGSLVVLGRGDAAVTTGGHTVLVEDVEAILQMLPGIREAAVVGTAHERLGQVLTAVVVLEPDATINNIRAAARQHLSGPSLPRRWHTVDALPRTPGGKIARAALESSVR